MSRRRLGDFTLTDKQNLVLGLHNGGMSNNDIADELGIQPGTVQKTLRRAKQLVESKALIARLKGTHDATERASPNLRPPSTSTQVRKDRVPERSDLRSRNV